MKVKELMTRKVFVLKPEDTLQDAAKLFIDHCIDGAPVVDEEGEIINIITKTDLMKAFVNKKAIDIKIKELGSKRSCYYKWGNEYKRYI